MNDNTAACSSQLNGLLLFLAGGLAGASVALLLAPQSGTATREMVRRKLNDTADSARDVRDQLIRRGQHVRDEASQRVSKAVSALKSDGEAQLPG